MASLRVVLPIGWYSSRLFGINTPSFPDFPLFPIKNNGTVISPEYVFKVSSISFLDLMNKLRTFLVKIEELGVLIWILY